MAQRLIGRRGKDENEWTWVPTLPPRPSSRPRRRLVALVVTGVLISAAIGTPLGLVLTRSSGDGNIAGARIPAASPTATATSAPVAPRVTPSPSSPPTIAFATPVPTTPTGTHFRLAAWTEVPGEWRFGDLNRMNSDFFEGEAIPFLVRIENAEPGTTYSLAIRYNCAADDVAAFDFVASYDSFVGTGIALAEEGPGRPVPDVTIAVPDDSSIEFDDEDPVERLFQLWNGTFASQPSGPTPDSACSGEKLVSLDITAQAETVFLLWGGHLAYENDWGEGRGASSQSSLFQMAVDLSGPGIDGEERRLSIEPGAIMPN